MSAPSLRERTTRAFFLFGATLLLVYAGFVYALLQWHDDRRELLHLEALTEDVLRDWRPGVEPHPNEPAEIYVGEEQLPADLHERLAGRAEGNYEIHLGTHLTNRNEFFVAVRRPAAGEPLFVVYHPDSVLEHLQFWQQPVLAILASGLAVLVGLGTWWGRRLAGRLGTPLAELAEQVGGLGSSREEAQQLVESLRRGPFDGEIGILADALADSLERIEGFVERERRFTRNASHELRSPLTASRGALELLEKQLADDDKALGRLGRIRRALDQMDETIEAFLWLAREEGTGPSNSFDLGQAVEMAVADLSSESAYASRIQLSVESAGRVEGPESLLRIVATNLVLNALQNSAASDVQVRVDGTRLDIEDSGPGVEDGRLEQLCRPFVSSHGRARGLGLTIVGEICSRFGWHLRAEKTDRGSLFQVELRR